jgi:hypothetical protein
MVLTVSFVLSPVIGLVCHRHLARLLARLDAGVEASGPHDFAVRMRALSSLALLASTASRPASVTIMTRPSVGWDGGDMKVIWVRRKQKYFCKRGWTANSLICPSGNQIEPALMVRRCPCVVSNQFRCWRTRHCEPTGRANARPMTGSAKQSSPLGSSLYGLLRCARNDGLTSGRFAGD